MDRGEMSFGDVFTVFMAIYFASSSAGQLLNMGDEYAKAKLAADNIFMLLDRRPPIDIESEEGAKHSLENADIELRDVVFKYPTRDRHVYRGLSLKIPAGSVVAVVGASGSGEDTKLHILLVFTVHIAD